MTKCFFVTIVLFVWILITITTLKWSVNPIGGFNKYSIQDFSIYNDQLVCYCLVFDLKKTYVYAGNFEKNKKLFLKN